MKRCLLPTTLLVAVFLTQTALAQPQARLNQLGAQIDALLAAGKQAPIEPLAREYINLAAQTGNVAAQSMGLLTLGNSLVAQQKFAPAEAAFKEALRLVETRRLEGAAQSIAQETRQNARFALAQLLCTRGRFEAAEQAFLKSIALREAEFGASAPPVTMPLIDLAAMYSDLRRYDEAERLFQRAQTILEAQPQLDENRLTYVLHGRAVLHSYQYQFAAAEALYLQEIELLEKLFGRDNAEAAAVHVALGQAYMAQHRLREALVRLEKALEIDLRLLGSEHLRTASVQLTLGEVLLMEGRFAEAEMHTKRSLATREKLLGSNHPFVGAVLTSLGCIYFFEKRDREALPLLDRGLAIKEARHGHEHLILQKDLVLIGQVYRNLGRYEDAERTYLRLKEILERHKSRQRYQPYFLLGSVYRHQKRLAEAEQILQQALQINEEAAKLCPDERVTFDRGQIFDNLALVLYDQGRKADAQQAYDRSLELHEHAAAAPGAIAPLLVKRAEIKYELGKLPEALPDIRRAITLAEQQRITYSGDDTERAMSFGRFSVIYEYMVRVQAKLGDVQEALDAMERGQARSLVDQMSVQGVDLLASIPADEAAPLRQRMIDASRAIALIEGQLQALDAQTSTSAEQHRQRREALAAQLRKAQADFAEVQADIRNASPAYRLVVGRDLQTVRLDVLQQYLREQNGLLLRYLIGHGESFVLVIPPSGEPRLVSLSTGEVAAARLGIAPGRLLVDRLNSLLMNAQGTGLLQRLRASAKSEAARDLTAPLAALCQVLIPDPERKALAEGNYDRLFVVPDGALTMLPFEALVVEPGEDPKYLLDVGPPVVYAPSATILHNLSQRKAAQLKGQARAVLSVGDPAYDVADADAAPTTQLAARSRYRSAGGQLARLPYSALESTWIEQVFSKQNIPVEKLLGATATEANVRAKLPGSQVVHLACHGLSDDTHGNLFGALALTPLRTRSADSGNDGFLTLGEIYSLDARACELAILSACDTNYGPHQQGEGVWALSRGFLVAGSRRVVASNWYVDDQAAASLISYFSAGIAAAEGSRQPPDYPKLLHNAKRWVRQQDKWSGPYYWATFVMLGGN